MLRFGIICTLAFLSLISLIAQSTATSLTTNNYWEITDRNSICWDLTNEDRLPHQGNIEMAGAQVASILYYDLDTNRQLSLRRDVIFPQLRTYNKFDEPDWRKYRAYFRRSTKDEVLPSICLNNKTIIPKVVDSVEIAGKLIFYHQPIEGLMISRTLYPSMESRFLVEEWALQNLGDSSMKLKVSGSLLQQSEQGYHGLYRFVAFSDVPGEFQLDVGATIRIPVYYGATLNEENASDFDFKTASQERDNFLSQMQQKLVLETPSKLVNTLFYFSKIRASESIFDSSMGKIHSPGGGNYYVGTWANDQVEYSGPFFPYLGYDTGNTAAYNTYRIFAKNQPTDESHIPYAFEIDGNFPMHHLDRGDAAMIAYGTTHYLLANADREMALELWPLVEWSLAYCHRKRNKSGAVQSESDEMEGRIETGTANLATSALYYGGLKYAHLLALELSLPELAEQYKDRQFEMEKVIENYFGATMEGLETYKYYAENKHLRHWICLPLSMGIKTRAKGTITALFDKLWTPNGVLVEYRPEQEGPKTFWDRGTLYALRGAFKAGASELAMEKLLAFSNKRLLGDHVPYVIEAYPENNMKHLSAESALYCRILTEGLLGIEPIGFRKFSLTPQLPDDWDKLELKALSLLSASTDIMITRNDGVYQVEVKSEGRTILSDSCKPGQTLTVEFQ